VDGADFGGNVPLRETRGFCVRDKDWWDCCCGGGGGTDWTVSFLLEAIFLLFEVVCEEVVVSVECRREGRDDTDLRVVGGIMALSLSSL
jgi:hypothetical protein